MKEKFPEKIGMYHKAELACNIEQMLGTVPSWDQDFERHVPEYNVTDIFNILPHSITYNGHRGDLCVSVVDIAYFSIDGDWRHVLVHHEPIPIDGDIYDAFYNMIVWLKNNNLM